MDFAVWHDGIKEGTGKWVLAVDRNRVLLANDEDKSLYWKDLKDCKLFSVALVDGARPVIPMQVQQQAIQIPSGLSLNGRN